MRYLPHTPRNFREIVLADFLRAQRLILRIKDEIDPQFRIATPEGDWWIGMMLDHDLGERRRQLSLVSRFMQWKLAAGFTVASELEEPDCVYCMGVTHRECHAVLSVIERDDEGVPIDFAPEQWLTREQIGDEWPSLLQTGTATLDRAMILELEVWFGEGGIFPAMRVDGG